MKKLAFISVFALLSVMVNAQDSIRRFEFGSTLATINSFNTVNYFAPDRPPVEYMNGLFFRYYKKRFAVRAHVSYSENSASYATPPQWTDGTGGDVNNKDFRIGVGGQFSLIKRKQWLYLFSDLSYRNLFSTGHSYGGIAWTDDKFSKSGNGFDFSLGLGLKIKVVKHVFLSPEFSYLLANQGMNAKYTSMITGKTSQFYYTETNAHPVIKIHLTVKI